MKDKACEYYGLKWNPFDPSLPVTGCRLTPALDRFIRRVMDLIPRGGFALLSGDPGTGKSASLRILCERLKELREVQVRQLTRPQCSIADFYREMGDLFEVSLRPHNRWAGAKVLRESWCNYMERALLRPILLVDEAQETQPAVLNELRLLSSSDLDARCLLTTILAGDERILAHLQTPALASLGTRIRARLRLGAMTPAELVETLTYLLSEAGQPSLMTSELIRMLSERSAGNLRVLMNLSHELLEEAFVRKATKLDEQLYLQVFTSQRTAGSPIPSRKGRL
jgi:type II secretory pathway predicted ATPase ExeA